LCPARARLFPYTTLSVLGVGARDHERRRGDLAADAQTGTDALGEGGLAGAEVADEDDEVAGAQARSEPLPQRPGRVGVRQLDPHPTYSRGTRAPSRVTIS